MINALSKNGKLIVVHSCGKDPGQELINKIWSKEKPFPSLAKEIYLDLKEILTLNLLRVLNFIRQKN